MSRCKLNLTDGRILRGNLAPGGAVSKITGKEGLQFTGKCRAFDDERVDQERGEDCCSASISWTSGWARWVSVKGIPNVRDARNAQADQPDYGSGSRL